MAAVGGCTAEEVAALVGMHQVWYGDPLEETPIAKAILIDDYTQTFTHDLCSPPYWHG
jgi:hypothetical protein